MKDKYKKILTEGLDLLINAVVILVLVMIIQTWIIAPFDVSGSSMCDTLNNISDECENGYGEKIIINEALYLMNDPARGDIVVFKAPEDQEKYFIKRVIGLPGETVKISEGKVYLSKEGEDFTELEENYLNETNKGNTKTYFSDLNTFVVPENNYFLMGDNRRASTDSRSCFSGTISTDCKNHPEKAFVSRDLIRGKAWVIWWPLKNIRILEKTSYSVDAK
ncbi:signal peptidase I [Patescibacteria group bacterium]|nr:signal peptidase I [Patescibacteria group bacterium]